MRIYNVGDKIKDLKFKECSHNEDCDCYEKFAEEVNGIFTVTENTITLVITMYDTSEDKEKFMDGFTNIKFGTFKNEGIIDVEIEELITSKYIINLEQTARVLKKPEGGLYKFELALVDTETGYVEARKTLKCSELKTEKIYNSLFNISKEPIEICTVYDY